MVEDRGLLAEDALRAAIDADRLMAVTAGIARWERLSGSEDELAAFHYIRDQLETFGLRPLLEFHEAYISLPGPSRLVVDDGTIVECSAHAFTVSSPAEGLSGELVWIQDAATATSDAVAGRIVMLDGRASAMGTLRLERLGALAQVYVHSERIHETGVSPQWGSPDDRKVGGYPRTPGIAIRQPDGERLKALAATRALSVTVHSQVETGWRRTPLLTADLPGETPEFVLVSCHVDSWYYGAMDNGSANATILEVARLLSGAAERLRRGVRFAFWSGHSHGKYSGSAWYAVDRWHELEQHCVAHVNCDSTGGMGASDLTMAPSMPETWQLAADAIHDVAGQKLVGKRIGRFGDQSFYGIGVPCIFASLSAQGEPPKEGAEAAVAEGGRSGTLGWWWHTPEDTIDKVDPDNLVRDTGVYLAVVHRLASSPRLPLDYRRAVEDAANTVASLAEAAGDHLDLSGLREDLARLGRRLAGFYEDPPADFDRRVLRLARLLVPFRYQEAGRFAHDWGGGLRPIPTLADATLLADASPDEARSLTVRLKQALRAAEHAVRRASALLDD